MSKESLKTHMGLRLSFREMNSPSASRLVLRTLNLAMPFAWTDFSHLGFSANVTSSERPSLTCVFIVPWWLRGSACNAGDLGLIPGSGKSPGEGNGNPLQYSCLGNHMDRGAWRATVHGVAKSRTRLCELTLSLCAKHNGPKVGATQGSINTRMDM